MKFESNMQNKYILPFWNNLWICDNTGSSWDFFFNDFVERFITLKNNIYFHKFNFKLAQKIIHQLSPSFKLYHTGIKEVAKHYHDFS